MARYRWMLEWPSVFGSFWLHLHWTQIQLLLEVCPSCKRQVQETPSLRNGNLRRPRVSFHLFHCRITSNQIWSFCVFEGRLLHHQNHCTDGIHYHCHLCTTRRSCKISQTVSTVFIHNKAKEILFTAYDPTTYLSTGYSLYIELREIKLFGISMLFQN